MIIKACQEGKFPNIKHSLFDQDPGLEHVSTLFEGIKSEGYKQMPNGISNILLEITSVSSTISLFQTMDMDLLNDIRKGLQDDQKDLLREGLKN